MILLGEVLQYLAESAKLPKLVLCLGSKMKEGVVDGWSVLTVATYLLF